MRKGPASSPAVITPNMIKALRSEEEGRSLAAAQALARMKSDDARRVLLEAMSDRKEHVVLNAILAMGDIGLSQDDAVLAANQITGFAVASGFGLGEASPAVILATAQSLAKFSTPANSGVKSILEGALKTGLNNLFNILNGIEDDARRIEILDAIKNLLHSHFNTLKLTVEQVGVLSGMLNPEGNSVAQARLVYLISTLRGSIKITSEQEGALDKAQRSLRSSFAAPAQEEGAVIRGPGIPDFTSPEGIDAEPLVDAIVDSEIGRYDLGGDKNKPKDPKDGTGSSPVALPEQGQSPSGTVPVTKGGIDFMQLPPTRILNMPQGGLGPFAGLTPLPDSIVVKFEEGWQKMQEEISREFAPSEDILLGYLKDLLREDFNCSTQVAQIEASLAGIFRLEEEGLARSLGFKQILLALESGEPRSEINSSLDKIIIHPAELAIVEN